MNELKWEVDGRTEVRQLPSGWAELDEKGFLSAVRMRLATDSGDDAAADDALRQLLDMDVEVFALLGAWQRMQLREAFSWTSTTDAVFPDCKLPSFEFEGTRYEGFTRHFSNLTWGEFLWADTFFMRQNFVEMAAVLYREPAGKRRGLDVRVPFDEYDMQRRATQFRNLPPDILTAILINYNAVRRASLEEKYPKLFPGRSSGSDGETKTEKTSDFSWFDIHHRLMGDRFIYADKFENARLSLVLAYLDDEIREAEKRKRDLNRH